ncbi:hypothetical protein BVY03_00620 [bacterium K02(2017)]|nr:hypothetical protein BVY03_00620 [bacterium K02(2017)]
MVNLNHSKSLKQKTSERNIVWGPLLSPSVTKALIYLPISFMLVLTALYIFPATYDFCYWLLKENHPVEILTSVVAFWAFIEGVRLIRLLSKKDGVFICGFIMFFTFLMFFLGMEEISWGQKIFDFPTPDFWIDKNLQ